MIGKLKNNITKYNNAELLQKYKKKIIIFSCLIIAILLLLPFYGLMTNILYLYPTIASYNSDFCIHILDTGEGLCSVIQFPTGEVLLYDTGLERNWSDIKTYLTKVICPTNNVIDYLVLSHIDADHSGNLLNIYNSFNVSTMYLPDMREDFNRGLTNNNSNYYNFCNQVLREKRTDIVYNKAGEKLVIGGVVINWLAPSRNYYANSNDYSAVLQIVYNDFAVLFTGDSGHNTDIANAINTEKEFILYAQEANINIDVDVLVAGHHGSKYSTSADLLDLTTPESIIVSVGSNNYGHPHNEFYNTVLDYDNINGTKLSNNINTTQEKGNIVVVANSNGEYDIQNINKISRYIFVPFYLIVIILLIPLIYCLLDNMIIYRKILINKYE